MASGCANPTPSLLRLGSDMVREVESRDVRPSRVVHP